MLNPADVSADARLYLRPEGFVDTPVGRDGEVARLAGGLLWFAAYELIAVTGTARVVQASVPVTALPALIANLPEPQAARLRNLAQRLSAVRAPLQIGARTLRFDQPSVVGILDIAAADDAEDPARRGFDMGVAGAAVIDVGGEPDRIGTPPLWEGDEIARVQPVVAKLAASGTPVSIATRKASVIEAALGAGAVMVDDASALLHDPRALGAVARAGCPVVLVHAPERPHVGRDILIEAYDWLAARIDAAVAGGIDRSRIIVDPGVGLAATLADNLALLNGLALFHGLGCPILVSASRDRMIGALANEAPAEQRLGGSLALALHAADRGVQLLRAHDVAETVQALRVWRGLRDGALMSRRE